jgi:hypothetical protein
MDKVHQKALSIFSSSYLKRAAYLEAHNSRFIQYTSAEAAMNIIKKNEIWLRNAQCMNDYSEIEHGLDCLLKTFKSAEKGEVFQRLLESIFPGIIDEFTNIFDSWIPAFRLHTYIACFSEHPIEENQYGRLSMWRAYGGDRPVALVLNNGPFLSDTDVFHADTNPVSYLDPAEFSEEFHQLSLRINSDKVFIKKLGKEKVINYLFDTFKNFVLCVKHPGFKEEREWRVVYNPTEQVSAHVASSIEVINGVPQEVFKIPLQDIPEENFYGATVPEFINKIIIGPCSQQGVLRQTFLKILEDAGCKNPYSKIHYSGIPLI